MNTNVKTFEDFDARQKLVQAIGNIAAAGVVLFLVLAWMLTSPLIQLIDQISGGVKLKTNKNKKITTKKL